MKDIEETLKILRYGDSATEYRKVKLFSDNSLKFFKKYKLDNKNVLCKVHSGDEILDLLSYNAKVTCYSSNKLDILFSKLKLSAMKLGYKTFINYFFNTKGSKELYLKFRNNLDNETKYFFDILYSYTNNLFDTNLVYNNYDMEVLKIYFRYLINKRFYEVLDNIDDIKFIFSSDKNISKKVNDKYHFINLSYNLDNMNEKRFNFVDSKINDDFKPLLDENGIIQAYTSKEKNDIDNYIIYETRSIDDPYTKGDICKKEYAYVYKTKEIN